MHEYLLLIKKAFVGDIYNENYESLSDGGPRCYSEMTVFFKTMISIFSITYHLVLMYISIKQVPQLQKTHKELKPNLIEKIIGILSLLILIVQYYFRINENRAIYMINPCHWCLTIQAILLLTPKSKTNIILFNIVIRWLFGAWSGVVFPIFSGFNQPYEIEFFFIEHYFAAIIQPATLFLFNRYGNIENIKFHYHLMGSSAFVLYQRSILFPLSMLSWANLNFTLCHSETDPFYPLFGKWYYLASEVYLGIIGGVMFSTIVFYSGWVIRKFYEIIILNNMAKEKSKSN